MKEKGERVVDCLERLAEQLKVEFVSDLRYLPMSTVWAERIQQLPAETFSQREYDEILQYLGENGVPCAGAGEGKERLVAWLSSERSGK